MEVLTVFTLFTSYFFEKYLGTPIKRTLLKKIPDQGKFHAEVSQNNTFFFILGWLLFLSAASYHQTNYYDIAFDKNFFFVFFSLLFLFFIHTRLCSDFARGLFNNRLKGEEDAKAFEILGEQAKLSIIPDLLNKGGDIYSAYLLNRTILHVESVVAPIFLFLVGGYFLFILYFFLYLFMLFNIGRNSLTISIYRGLLFFPMIFSLLTFTITAFVAGRSITKVTGSLFRKIEKTGSLFNFLIVKNTEAVIASLEIKLVVVHNNVLQNYDYGEEKVNQRTFILTQRFLGIHKLFIYVFSFYLFFVF